MKEEQEHDEIGRTMLA